MPLRSIAFLLYFCGSSAAALAVPMAGVLCYIVLYHVFPQTTWWGEPLNSLGIRYAYVCGACVVVGTALNLARLRFGRRFCHPIEWGMVVMLLIILLSGVASGAWTERTDLVVDKMAKVFLFAFLMAHVAVTRERIWYVVIVFAVMALYLGHEAKTAPPSAFTHNRLDGIGGPDFRASTGLAVHLTALLPFAVILIRQKALWLKALGFFASCYAANAILLCRARSAFVAALAAGLVAVWYVPRRHRRWVALVLVLGAVGGLTLSDEYFWKRMETLTDSAEQRDSSVVSRLEIWTAACAMFRDRPLGVGAGQFETTVPAYLPPDAKHQPDAHNTYLLCLGETGIQGLVVYLLILGMTWTALGQLSRQAGSRLANPDRLQLIIFATRLALVVYMVAGLFTSRLYTEAVWMLIALTVCLSRTVENELRVQARQHTALEKALPALLEQQGLVLTT